MTCCSLQEMNSAEFGDLNFLFHFQLKHSKNCFTVWLRQFLKFIMLMRLMSPYQHTMNERKREYWSTNSHLVIWQTKCKLSILTNCFLQVTLILVCGYLMVSCYSCSWHGGLELVQHPGHGGDWVEQAGERPGFRGHPETTHLWRWPRAEGNHTTSTKTITGRDSEETKCCWGEEEGVWGSADFRLCFVLS